MDDVSLRQFASWHGQAQAGRLLGVTRQRVWDWINSPAEWRVKIRPDRTPDGYYRYRPVSDNA